MKKLRQQCAQKVNELAGTHGEFCWCKHLLCSTPVHLLTCRITTVDISFESKHWRAWFDEAVSDVQELLSMWDWMSEELRLFKYRKSVPPQVTELAPGFRGPTDPRDDWTHQFNASVHAAVRLISYRRVKITRTSPIYMRSAALSKRRGQQVWFMINGF